MSVNEMKKLPEFSGPFKDIIPRFIEYRKAQGIKISSPFVYHLRRMDLFFKKMGVTEPEITREMYDEWTKIMPPEKESNTQKRQSTLRSFAKYLVSTGYENIYTGYDDTRIFKKDKVDYLVVALSNCKLFTKGLFILVNPVFGGNTYAHIFSEYKLKLTVFLA